MFQSARLKLTLWYVALIMLITVLFSLAFYNSSTREIDRLIRRVEFDQRQEAAGLVRFPFPRPRNFPTVEELQSVKRKSLYTLIVVNGAILAIAAGASYFLAGKTLEPISSMMDEQSQFIANASHELRTPIATLRAEMEGSLLEKNISDKQARRLITSNLEELTSLQELTNAMLRLTQVHELNHGQKTESISIAEVLSTAQKKITPLAKKKHITLSVAATDAQVQGTQQSLTEVFVILLDNAIKYSPEKTNITVTTRISSNVVQVEVQDHGCGISDTDLPLIFKRFYRADKSRSQADGYGLGLSIAKQLVEAHHGKIIVSSTVDQGTTFTVELPIS